MLIEKNLYDSKYLYEKYKIEIFQEYGNILEDLSVGVLKIQDENVLSYFGLKNLQKYLIDNSNLMDWRMMVLLQKPDVQQYFIARWLLRNIQESVNNNEEETLINLFSTYFNATIIADKVISIIKGFYTDEYDTYADYLKRIFNNIIKEKVFANLEKKDSIIIFINLWKIVKVFSGKRNPVKKDNMSAFCAILRKLSLINEDKRYINLAGLDLAYIDFSGMDLSEAYFRNVYFCHSNFQSANLDAICLSGSDLSYANFDSAFMECSHMENCNCKHVKFNHAHLLSSVVSGADFSYADLSNANFMECDADRIVVKGLKINDKTAVNDTDFRYVNWEDVDISGLSISENQISHFWEVVNYTRNTILYDAKFRKLENNDIQNVIYKELKDSSSSYLAKTKLLKDVKDIFISYASEEKHQYAFPIYDALRNNYRKYSVWIDDANLYIGSQLRREIESVIKYCKLIVIIYSENYIRKGWTRYELLRSLQEYEERKVNIIVINLMRGDKMPDSYFEISKRIPKENQYNTNNINEIKDKILENVKMIL